MHFSLASFVVAAFVAQALAGPALAPRQGSVAASSTPTPTSSRQSGPSGCGGNCPSGTYCDSNSNSCVAYASSTPIGGSCFAKGPSACATGQTCASDGNCSPFGAPSSTPSSQPIIGGDCFALGPNGCNSGSTCVSATPSAYCSKITGSSSATCGGSVCPPGSQCDQSQQKCVPFYYSSSTTPSSASSSTTTSSKPVSSTPNSGAERVLAGAGVGFAGLIAAALL